MSLGVFRLLVNFMKQSLDYEELLHWCKLIIERNK